MSAVDRDIDHGVDEHPFPPMPATAHALFGAVITWA